MDEMIEEDSADDGLEESRELLTDGGGTDPLGDDLESEGRLSRARKRLSGAYESASESAPESPLVWAGGAIGSGYVTSQIEDEAWDSLMNEFPEHTDQAVDNAGQAASYLAEAGINSYDAVIQLGEAGVGAAAAIATAACGVKAVQKYRDRE
ncbi:MAG: hypothetical protein ABEJ07_05730 [Candidatus Nanohaloarchaea archaeon]